MKKLILWFANCIWWPFWSNIRWNSECKLEAQVEEAHLVKNLTEIKTLVKTLYTNFNWTADGADQLGDSICPPAYNYKRWQESVLKDDCDGFHSLVYHCLSASNIECYLLSVTHLKGGHCVLLFKYNGKWYVNDYTRVHKGFATAAEAIADYNTTYIKSYEQGKQKYLYNAIVSFDYKAHKFRTVKLKNLK